MDIPNTLFATMIRNARMDLHWTQEELAEKLVLHPGRNQSLVLTDSRQCKAKFQRRCGHRLEILTKQWRESGCNKL